MDLAGTTYSKNTSLVLLFWHRNNEMWEEKEPEKLHIHCSQQSSEARLESCILPNSPARSSSENVWELIFLHLGLLRKCILGGFDTYFSSSLGHLHTVQVDKRREHRAWDNEFQKGFWKHVAKERRAKLWEVLHLQELNLISPRGRKHCCVLTGENWHGRKVWRTSSQGKLWNPFVGSK